MMWSVSWFGIGSGDPQGAEDPSFGNWTWGPACGLANDPASCVTFGAFGMQRSIASLRRPLAGIYSSSGRSEQSRRRIDLALSTLRRPCDDGARLDAFAVQFDSVQFTSRYPDHAQAPTWDIAYRALLSFVDRAERAGLKDAVAVTLDATSYWHFGSTFGLTTQQSKIDALRLDIVDMAKIASASSSAVKIDGRPLLVFYLDQALMNANEWLAVLDAARNVSGIDFFALGTARDPGYFAAFDALSPWVDPAAWAGATGSDLAARASSYAATLHGALLTGVKSFPGRVVFGGASPGFDDYTKNWGACVERRIPRDPSVLEGQTRYLGAQKKSGAFDVRGVVLQTWDDWTEGTEFEPDVEEGPAKLVQLRQQLGSIFGDPSDPSGDARLDARWRSFGQARDCCAAGGACVTASTVPVGLDCNGDAGAPAGGVDAGIGDAASAPGADARAPSDPAPPATTSACTCLIARGSAGPGGWVVFAFGAAVVAARRRRRNHRLASLVSLAAAGAACNALTGAEERTLDVERDASPERVDAGARPAPSGDAPFEPDALLDASSYCSRRADAAGFCVDFDESTSALQGWSSVFVTDGGALALDTATSVSPPRSLRASALSLAADASAAARVYRTFNATVSEAHLAFDIRVDKAATDGSPARAVALTFDQGGGVYSSLTLELGATTALGEEVPSGGTSRVFTRTALTASLPVGAWARVKLDAVLVAPLTVTVTLGSQVVLDRHPLPAAFKNASFSAQLGVVYLVGPTPGFEAHFDNVTVDTVP